MDDCQALAHRLLAEEPALTSSLDFGPFVTQGTGAGPALIIGDQSEINLLRDAPDGNLEHRMALLAGPGDMVLVRRRDRAFERYLAHDLGLGDVTFAEVGNQGAASVARCAQDSPQIIEELTDLALANDGLTLRSYLTSAATWQLAAAIGKASGRVIHVAGPSPRVSQRANDKLWFSSLARGVIGRHATPPTLHSYGPTATTALVQHLSRMASEVIVKVPDSAGSAGNIKLQHDAIAGRDTTQLQDFLLDALHAVGWHDQYPLLVGLWDEDVLCSPSVQLWIPLVGDGPPVSEGVFEQAVLGEEAAFVGATRSTLPDAFQRQLVREAVRIATVLQQIGYYGRCSLDAVICGNGTDKDVIHWIECNGRWGGVSIPLTLTKSLLGTVPDGFRIIQQKLRESKLSTQHLLDHIDGLHVGRKNRAERLILLSPAPSATGTSLNLLALAETVAAADAIVTKAVQRIKSTAGAGG